ncbi:unnamed protein product [Discosporangium mesarthrocarpum]
MQIHSPLPCSCSCQTSWKTIATMVSSRNHVQCLQRWKKVLRPGLVKGQWSAEEDEQLVKLVGQGFKNWGALSENLSGRTSKQCRERWCHHLDPSIIRGEWTGEEDDIIMTMHQKIGNKWSSMAPHLVGRTENAIKTRWKALDRSQQTHKKPQHGKAGSSSRYTPNLRLRTLAAQASALAMYRRSDKKENTVVGVPHDPRALEEILRRNQEVGWQDGQSSEQGLAPHSSTMPHSALTLTAAGIPSEPEKLAMPDTGAASATSAIEEGSTSGQAGEDSIRDLALPQVRGPGTSSSPGGFAQHAPHSNGNDSPGPPSLGGGGEVGAVGGAGGGQQGWSRGRDVDRGERTMESLWRDIERKGPLGAGVASKGKMMESLVQRQAEGLDGVGAGDSQGDQEGQSQTWKAEEVGRLREAVEREGEGRWKAVAGLVGTRNPAQCMQKWNTTLRSQLVGGAWSPEEDQILLSLADKNFSNWDKVASCLPGRTLKECRERWEQHDHLETNTGNQTSNVDPHWTEATDRMMLTLKGPQGNSSPVGSLPGVGWSSPGASMPSSSILFPNSVSGLATEAKGLVDQGLRPSPNTAGVTGRVSSTVLPPEQVSTVNEHCGQRCGRHATTPDYI